MCEIEIRAIYSKYFLKCKRCLQSDYKLYSSLKLLTSPSSLTNTLQALENELCFTRHSLYNIKLTWSLPSLSLQSKTDVMVQTNIKRDKGVYIHLFNHWNTLHEIFILCSSHSSTTMCVYVHAHVCVCVKDWNVPI